MDVAVALVTEKAAKKGSGKAKPKAKAKAADK
jgi:hypothetical protein